VTRGREGKGGASLGIGFSQNFIELAAARERARIGLSAPLEGWKKGEKEEGASRPREFLHAGERFPGRRHKNSHVP